MQLDRGGGAGNDAARPGASGQSGAFYFCRKCSKLCERVVLSFCAGPMFYWMIIKWWLVDVVMMFCLVAGCALYIIH